MDEEKRIKDDIVMFDRNVLDLELTPDNAKLIDIAKRYRIDAQHYLGKKDYVTAFGCINYAHGLIDALRRKW
ncbi:MAG: DUF357 domain-containing protein [Candidatus Micrarchaeota archaeon]|nr:DUF357 domain-containing protein [Candidatus Micrarchaeota archaeon]